MSRRRADAPGFSRLDIVRGVSMIAALVLLVGASLEERGSAPEGASPPDGRGTDQPIAAEADVFRAAARGFAVAPDYRDDGQAHVRSLEIYRRLRAYPGAPPRIPHGLTDQEFRTAACTGCHGGGGWVQRFGAYAPVTPHPEYGACLQCHTARDELVGMPLPESEDASVCAQCHVNPGQPARVFVASDWRSAAWPATGLQAMPGSPNRIPHADEGRGNCLACHAGPAAIPALRTDHPERANCRQCHVSVGLSGATETFVGPDAS